MNIQLSSLFAGLGLTKKHALLFRAIARKTSSTPLSLARETGLNRSSIYRYLEDLKAAGLVDEILEPHSSRYAAGSPESLQAIILKQEAKLQIIRDGVPKLIQELQVTRENQAAETQVKYFRGVEGLKQMLWNAVGATHEFVGFGFEDWNTSVGRSFAEKLRLRHIERGISSRELLNTLDPDYSYTRISRMEYQRFYTHRAIDPQIITIKHDTYIYDDVFAFYYHYLNEYFGVEIHNAEIAQTQKQIFEVLWNMAGHDDPKPSGILEE